MAVREQARRVAFRHERDRRAVEVVAERVVNRVVPQINAKLIGWFERGLDLGAHIGPEIDRQLTELIQRAMTASHLTGRLRSARTLAVTLRKRRTMAAYDNALTFLQRRLALNPDQMQRLMDHYGNEAARITRELGYEVERAAQQAITRAIDRGEHIKEAVATLREAVAGVGETPPMSPGLVTTLVRTQTQMAYSAGRWTANADAAIQEILWGYEYATVGDDRVRGEHEGLDGTRLPKDDPRWSEIWTPNGFQCRCTTVEIMTDEKDLAEVREPPATFVASDGSEVVPGPDKGWAFNPAEALAGVL